MPEYEVIERSYSWGTHAMLFRHSRLVMFADLYRNGSYRVFTHP